jgi:predicted DNA-binding transcriptional regulator AlpA
MEKPTGDVPLLLDEVGAEKFCGVSRYTLRALRRARRGPTVVKLGRSIRFRPEDLAAFVAANRVAPADLPKPKRRSTSGR